MATERTVLVRLKANVNDFNRGLAEAATGVSAFRKEINTTNDRTAWLTQGILALAPAVAPLGAAAVPVLTGLVTQMTVAGVAAGTLALGFNGVGDALKALNDYQLEPTAEHLQKLQEQMGKIGPQGEQFVLFLDSIGPQLASLSDEARAGMFPGMEAGIEHLLDLLPRVKVIVGQVAAGIGQLTSEAGENLAGPKFEEFFQFLETDAQPILIQFGHSIGNVLDGIAALMVDFLPLSQGFSSGLEDATKAFAEWAHSVDETQGFQDFIAYVQASGPKALDFLGALSEAVIQIVEAAAPVGDIMLPVFTNLLKIIAALANTPMGSTIIALAALVSLYGRVVAIGSNVGTGFTSFLKKTEEGADKARMSLGRMAGTGALLALTMTDLDDKMGLTNTASFALAGTMIGGKWGAAMGAGIGLVSDFRSEQHLAADATSRWNDILDRGGNSLAAYSSAVAQANADVASLQRQSGMTGGALNHILAGFTPTGIDTNLHAIFGDIEGSQVGQAETARNALMVQQLHMQETGNLLAQMTGVVGPTGTASIEQMGAAITRLQPAMDQMGVTTQDLSDAFGRGDIGLIQRVIAARNAMDSTRGRTKAVADVIAGLGNNASSAAEKATALQQAMEDLLSPGMDLTATTDAWFHALRHLNEALGDGAKKLTGHSDAAEQNRAAIGDLVTKMEARLSAEVKSGMSSERVTSDFRKMRQAIIDTAEAHGLDAKAVEHLLDNWKLTPKFVQTLYKAQGVDVALKAAGNLRDLYNKLPKNVQTYIATHGIPESKADIDDLKKKFDLTPKQVDILINIKNAAAMAGIRATASALAQLRDKTIRITTVHAQGGRVLPGMSGGGYTGPGDKFEPRGIVHANELVLPSDIVNRDWAMLKARYGALPGFAEGGLVGVGGIPTRANHAAAGRGPALQLTVDEIPVRGRVDVDSGVFEGMARVTAHDVYSERSKSDSAWEGAHA